MQTGDSFGKGPAHSHCIAICYPSFIPFFPLGNGMFWVSPSFVSSLRHDDCLNLLYQAWFLDDGVLAGTMSSLLRAITDMGPS